VSRRSWSELLVLAYPAWWRQQYGAELARLAEDLVTSGRSPILVAWSVVRGGVATRCSATGMPPVPALFAERTKWLLASAVTPMVIGGWLAADAQSTIWQRVQGFQRYGFFGRVANDAWGIETVTLFLGMFVGFLAWSIVFDAMKWQRERRPRLLAALVCLPLLGIAAGIAHSFLAPRTTSAHVWHGPIHGGHYVTTVTSAGGHPLIAGVLGLVSAAGGIGFFTLTPAAALHTLRRVPADPYLVGRALRVGWALVVVCSCASLAGAVATIAAAHTGVTAYGPRGVTYSAASPVPWSLLELAGVLAALAVLGGAALVAAGRAWRASSVLAA
jgi:hypothetical protein